MASDEKAIVVSVKASSSADNSNDNDNSNGNHLKGMTGMSLVKFDSVEDSVKFKQQLFASSPFSRALISVSGKRRVIDAEGLPDGWKEVIGWSWKEGKMRLYRHFLSPQGNCFRSRKSAKMVAERANQSTSLKTVPSSQAVKNKKTAEKRNSADGRGVGNLALFACDLCGKEFNNFGSWSGHRSMHSKELAERRESGATTSSTSVIPKQERLFFCLVCEKLRFENAQTLVTHLREKHNWSSKRSTPEATGKKKGSLIGNRNGTAAAGKGGKTLSTTEKSIHPSKACETIRSIKQELDAVPIREEASAQRNQGRYSSKRNQAACNAENGSKPRGGKEREMRYNGKAHSKAGEGSRPQENGEANGMEINGTKGAVGQCLAVVVQRAEDHGAGEEKKNVVGRQNRPGGRQKKSYESTPEYPGVYLCDVCRKRFNRFSAWNGHRSKHSREIAKRKGTDPNRSSEAGDGSCKKPKRQVWLFSCSLCKSRFTAANLLHAHTEICGRTHLAGDFTPRDRVNGKGRKSAIKKPDASRKSKSIGPVIHGRPCHEETASGQERRDSGKAKMDEDLTNRNWQLVPYVSQVQCETSMAGDLVQWVPAEDVKPAGEWEDAADERTKTDGARRRDDNCPDRSAGVKGSGAEADVEVKMEPEDTPNMDYRKRKVGGFVCPICMESFSMAAELGEHMGSHPVGAWSCTFSHPKKSRNGGAGKGFPCPVCGEAFATEQGLAGHKELYHNAAVKQRMDAFMERNSCGKCERNSASIDHRANGHHADCTVNNQGLKRRDTMEDVREQVSPWGMPAAVPCEKAVRGDAENGLGNGGACTLANGRCDPPPGSRKNAYEVELTRVWWKTGEVVLEDNGACVICEKKADSPATVMCDLCDQKFHLSCLDPPLLNVPDSDWCCPICTVRTPP